MSLFPSSMSGPDAPASASALSAALLVALAVSGCLPEWPPRRALAAASASSGGGGADGGSTDVDAAGQGGTACRPLWTGELRLHELVVRPTGLDFDGDGVVNLRDEWIEVMSTATEPAHAAGVVLYVDGVRRGEVVSGPCLAPGALAVLVGSTTGTGGSAAAVTRLELNASLKLLDDAGTIELRSLAGAVHDVAAPPPAPAEGPAVWTRWPQVDPDGGWRAHAEVAGGRPWSPGLCADGALPPGCQGGP